MLPISWILYNFVWKHFNRCLNIVYVYSLLIILMFSAISVFAEE